MDNIVRSLTGGQKIGASPQRLKKPSASTAATDYSLSFRRPSPAPIKKEKSHQEMHELRESLELITTHQIDTAIKSLRNLNSQRGSNINGLSTLAASSIIRNSPFN